MTTLVSTNDFCSLSVDAQAVVHASSCHSPLRSALAAVRALGGYLQPASEFLQPVSKIISKFLQPASDSLLIMSLQPGMRLISNLTSPALVLQSLNT